MFTGLDATYLRVKRAMIYFVHSAPRPFKAAIPRREGLSVLQR
jgi:hypothetical protein